MKVLTKPLSSPSRAEKFPPPLMRFLRSNVGSRSRGRSRSSPMFYLRSSRRSAPAAIQEPSSPKVTCIGQVRVRRSAKSKSKSKPAAAVKSRRWWLSRPLCFGEKSSPKLRKHPFCFRGMFCYCKCGSIFGCRKVDSRDSFRVNSDSRSGKIEKLDAVSNGHCSSNDNLGEINRGILETSSSTSTCSPPKNALMLTRCRSAPYRSSSLGGRFWGSPLAEKDDEEDGDDTAKIDGKLDDELPASCIPIKEEEEENVEEIKKIGAEAVAVAVHPLLLTRCKSEPARIGERLSAEAILLRPTRLVDDDDHHHHNHLVRQNS